MAELVEGGSLETRADAGEGKSGRVALWLRALDLADKEEEDWRKRAETAIERLRDEADRKGVRFNIFGANTETLLPALYNSTPIPDVRRRNSDRDPAGKYAAQIIDRVLKTQLDQYDFDAAMKTVVYDSLTVGRGVARVVFEPYFDDDGMIADASMSCKYVNWRDFRRGPGRAWNEVPWVAFRHLVTREEAAQKFGRVGNEIPLDWTQAGARKADEKDCPDIFKRATVWEIWDKSAREVVFVAKAYAKAPLKVEKDLLQIEGFFPIPRPLYSLPETNSLVPLIPFDRYKDQASELDRMTQRLHSLIAALRWRGVRASEITEFDRLKDADDGELVPAENIMPWIDKGGLENAIWLMPIEKLIAVIRELVQQREVVKQNIYELTGVADIMRGVSQASETLGAQRIKAQWGSLRLQDRQRETQRFVRDILRMKAELAVEHMTPEQLLAMSQIRLPTQQEKALAQPGQPAAMMPAVEEVLALLKSDRMRLFRVDIETDSTIQADLGYAQENVAKFVEGMSGFFTAVGPAVQSGAMPMDVAVDMLTGFARHFQLGKQAEDALDRLSQQAEDARAQPQQQQRPDPETIKAQAAEQRAEQELALKARHADADQQLAREKAAAEQTMAREKAVAEFALKQQQIAADIDLQRKRHDDESAMIRERHDQERSIKQADFEGSESGKALATTQQMVATVEAIQPALAQAMEALNATLQGIASLQAALVAPKSVDLKRDRAGRLIGATTHVTLQ